MYKTSIFEISQWADGALIQGIPSSLVSSFFIDTRKYDNEDVFIALKGENFNGHDFINKVTKFNVKALIVSEIIEILDDFEGAIIHVRDTTKALQNIAFNYRLKTPYTRTIGITGSNGKTTTKDFLSSILGEKNEINSTIGNYNNHIGLPISILRGEDYYKYGVFEIGMNHAGEIAELSQVLNPDIAVITNIGKAHIGNLGSKDAIAKEKSELAKRVSYINNNAFVVMPKSDEYFSFIKKSINCDLISVGINSKDSDVNAINLLVSSNYIKCDIKSKFADVFSVKVPVFSIHMLTNAILAIAVALKEGINNALISNRISKVSFTGNRLEQKLVNGLNFIDDSYNSNPDSVLAALTTLEELKVSGNKVLVLSEMGELGEVKEEEHSNIGKKILDSSIDFLIVYGNKSNLYDKEVKNNMNYKNLNSHKKIAMFLKEQFTTDDLILIKGSRSFKMENIIKEVEKI